VFFVIYRKRDLLSVFPEQLIYGQKCDGSTLVYFIYLGIVFNKSHLLKSKSSVFDGKRKFSSCCIAEKKPHSCLELSGFFTRKGTQKR